LNCVGDPGYDGDFVVTPPSHRFDIAIEEDLIEELARLHGYDNIPAPPPKARMAMLPQTESRRATADVRRLLAGRGFCEVVNFSFVEAAWEADFCGNAAPITLANPIASQMGVMRSSLIGGLVGNLIANRSRQVERVRAFEIGRCFIDDAAGAPVAGFRQPLRVAGLCAGTALPEQWGAPSRAVDFFDLKAEVEALLAPAAPRFEKATHPALHPGRAATVLLDGQVVGVVGELHPRWVQKYELGTAPVVFELELEALLARSLPAYREISRFPAVTRDIALVVGQEQAVQPLLDALKGRAAAIVRSVELFDVYQGKGLPEGKKSLAFRIVMQDTQRTLSDGEVEAALNELVATAQAGFGAELRK
jgi:phenylalanyl-tRNA synthetase beta chain